MATSQDESMSASGFAPQEAAWLEVQPIIRLLYLEKQSPLSTVRRIMREKYNFKATTAMYKRRLHSWGYRKNRPPQQTTPPSVAADETHCGGSPQILQQNDIDHSLNILLDSIEPWISHGYLFWQSSEATKHVYCPAPAAYIYDDFTRRIAMAISAFRGGDIIFGGSNLRHAFVDLETTLAPSRRSIYTLHSLLFGLATLAQAGLLDAARMLAVHATNLVVGHRLHSPSQTQDSCTQASSTDHASHPFPRILLMLRALALALEHDGAQMMRVLVRTWSAYNRRTGAANARFLQASASDVEFWAKTVEAHRRPALEISGPIGWDNPNRPEAATLRQLVVDQSSADCAGGAEMRSLAFDQLMGISSFAGDPRFVLEALGALPVHEDMDGGGGGEDLEREGNMCLALMRYFGQKGDAGMVIRCVRRLLPATQGSEWKPVVTREFHRWE